MKKNKNGISDPTLKELDAIKRLLILFLLKAGTSQSEIALALNMNQGDLSRMLPARKFKPFQASN
jgi:DNA-binding MarR family transcriptional regulator